tara:strand:+ start:444 stop:836 length:393 start_codon:yes stop_codon:yes gene_type:complete
MRKSKIKIGSNKSFGIVFFAFFAILALWPLLNNEEIRYSLLLIALIFLILGLLNSKLLTPLNIYWFKIGIFLGSIISPIVMGLIFFMVVTPIGLIMRLLGKDLIKINKNKLTSTYWIDRDKQKSSLKKQF